MCALVGVMGAIVVHGGPYSKPRRPLDKLVTEEILLSLD